MAQGGVKELAQGGDLNMVNSPRKVNPLAAEEFFFIRFVDTLVTSHQSAIG